MNFVKSINIKDVVYMSAAAWDDIPASTITKSWNKLLVDPSSQCDDQSSTSTDDQSHSASASPEDQSASLSLPGDQTSCEQLAEQLNANFTVDDGSIDINAWLNEDSSDPGYQLYSDEEIIEQVTAPVQIDVLPEDDDDEYPAVLEVIPTSGEVADMLDICLLWYERQQESTATSALLLKRIRDLAASKRYANLKQRKITFATSS